MNEEFHKLTETWVGKLQYGEFVGNEWFGVGGPNHPLIQKIIKEIQEIPNINVFDVFITGGILEDWITWDLDVILTGSYQPKHLIKILRDIVKIGFDNHTYIDVVFKETLWRIDLMKPESLNEDKSWIWEYSNIFKKNDEWIRKYQFYPENGLFKRYNVLPFKKHLDKISEGYTYKKPVQIVFKSDF